MIVIVMGVSGAGKTTVGRLLAGRLGWEFRDADDFHPPENVAKMRAGTPLDDRDRAPWLAAIRGFLTAHHAAGGSAVVACSALKAAYRDVLRGTDDWVRFVHLEGSPELIGARLAARQGHYMPPSLLASQMATLEPPGDAVRVTIDRSPAEIVERVCRSLELAG